MSQNAPPAAHGTPGEGTEPPPTGTADRTCPICRSEELVEFAGRADARCGACDALERHRALARQMSDVLRDGAGRAALEVGPVSARVFGDFLRELGWRYQSVDRSRRGHPSDPRAIAFIDFEADLCNLSPFDEDSIDLVIVQHVIEEIPAYQTALEEIARVLAPEGTALLEIPFTPGLECSERQPPDRFGNVWRFGADLPDAVRERFARVELVVLKEAAYLGRLLVCRSPRMTCRA